jgi:Domain of unknown function (DUF4129)
MLQLIPATAHGARGWARALLIVGTGTMATAWLATWIALIGNSAGASTALPGPVQEGVVLGGAGLAWWLLGGPLGERWVRVLYSAGFVPVAALLAWVRFYRAWFPLDPRWLERALQTIQAGAGAPLLTWIACVLVLWWAGGRIGAGALDDYDLVRFFLVGLAGLLCGLLANSMAGVHGATAGLGLAVALFFATAFLTVPLAQLLAAQARGRASGTSPAPLDHRWLLTAGSATLLILSIALLLSASISTTLLDAIAAALGRLPDLLAIILYPIALAGGYLVQALIWLADRLRNNAGNHPHAPRPAPSPAQNAVHGRHNNAQLPPLLHFALEAAAIIGVVAVVAIVLSRAVGRLGMQRREQPFEEERDSIWSWEEMEVGWRALLRRLRPHLAARHTAAGAAGPPRSVREAYRRLLRSGAAMGHPRARPETPQEYLGRLRLVPFPDQRDAALITAAYTRVRYGDEQEQPTTIEHVAQAAERLDRAVKNMPR